MQPTRLAVIGPGLIGARHVAAINRVAQAELTAIVGQSDRSRAAAEDEGVPWFGSVGDLIDRGAADGVVLAIPNQLHAETAMACIDGGIPVLVEKPLTDDVASGRELVRRAADAGVALLTGHHRRYNPLIQKAVDIVTEGSLGQLTAVQAQTWFRKPDYYYDVEWRREEGAGPVYLNLIHDVQLLQTLCGPIEAVHAMESNAVRGFDVEETAVVLLRFANGVLGTVNVSDAATAPWSWELTARENAHYAATGENCYWIAGTEGSLALPNLALWRHTTGDGWWADISSTRFIFDFEDPLIRQIEHFVAVIRGEAEPLVSGADGLAAVEVIEAVKLSTRTGTTVRLADV